MLVAPSQLDDIVGACAERFGTAPHRYYVEDWNGSVLVLTFYGDESFGGRQAGFQGCYAAAGCITSAEVWQQEIVDDWQKALSASPSIAYFRMSECFAAIEGRQQKDEESPFSGMSARDAREKLEAVVSVVEGHRHQIGGVQSIITWDCFDNGLNDADKALYGSPFSLCVEGIVDGCRQLLRHRNEDAPIAFVFDERRDVSEKILQAWNITKAASVEDAAIMGSVSFQDDKNCLPLQCADLVAWHARREYIKPVEDHGRPRPEHRRLTTSLYAWYEHIWNEEKLREDRDKKWKVYKNLRTVK